MDTPRHPDEVTADPDVLRELQAAAAVKRAARRRVADALVGQQESAEDLAAHRRNYDIATGYWVALIHRGAAAGHPVSAIARAAGVAASSIYYRLM